MQQLIKELKEADATLENDGYKSWCYTRLAIAKAIETLQKPILDKANVSGSLPHSIVEINSIVWFKIFFVYGKTYY